MAEAATAAPVEAEAEYHDGQQARPLWLRARLAGSALELRRAGGEAVASWPVAALRVVDRTGGALRLAPDGSDARLLVSDSALVAALEAAQRPRRKAALKRRLRMAALAAVAVPAGALAFWKGWPPAADALARAVPAEWERSIGTATAAALIGGKRVCDSPAGQAALDGLVAKLAAAGGVAAPVQARARVLDVPTVNALAAPGGEIILYRGLLDRAGSAEEVAGVLAHEIGHVEHRHGLRGVARAAGLFVLTGALSGGSDAVALGATLATLAHSRDFEREADATGARILLATGIGTEGLEAFFTRMEGAAGALGSLWAYIGTHPASADRASALREAVQPATKLPALSAAEWAAVRSICGPARHGGKPLGASKSERSGLAEPSQARQLGVFASWEAWIDRETTPRAFCYALAHPTSTSDTKRARRSKFWVTHRPWSAMDAVSFAPDEKPAAGAALWIEVDGERSPLRMRGANALPRDTVALSSALRAAAAKDGAEAVIGWSEVVKGEEAPTHSYRLPLGGLLEAYAAISEACAETPPASGAPSPASAR